MQNNNLRKESKYKSYTFSSSFPELYIHEIILSLNGKTQYQGINVVISMNKCIMSIAFYYFQKC